MLPTKVKQKQTWVSKESLPTVGAWAKTRQRSTSNQFMGLVCQSSKPQGQITWGTPDLYLNSTRFWLIFWLTEGNSAWQIYCITVRWKPSILSVHILEAEEKWEEIPSITSHSTHWEEESTKELQQEGATLATSRDRPLCSPGRPTALGETAEQVWVGLLNGWNPCFLLWFPGKFFSSRSATPVISMWPCLHFHCCFQRGRMTLKNKENHLTFGDCSIFSSVSMASLGFRHSQKND